MATLAKTCVLIAHDIWLHVCKEEKSLILHGRLLEFSLAILDSGISYCARLIGIWYGRLGTFTNGLYLFFDLSGHGIVHRARWAVCNLIDVSEGENVTNSCSTRLNKHGSWALKAEEELGYMSVCV